VIDAGEGHDLAHAVDDLAGAVAAAVVDHDDAVLDAVLFHRLANPLEQRRERALFVVRGERDDDHSGPFVSNGSIR